MKVIRRQAEILQQILVLVRYVVSIKDVSERKCVPSYKHHFFPLVVRRPIKPIWLYRLNYHYPGTKPPEIHSTNDCSFMTFDVDFQEMNFRRSVLFTDLCQRLDRYLVLA